MFTNHIYLIYINKLDLALNNLQWFICHKTKPNRSNTAHLTETVEYTNCISAEE